ncbi:LamG domain-containing protein [Candidatus Binatia bacterium]|nr:LamG domain-containing protein [Candidatus Binatia bacterium]
MDKPWIVFVAGVVGLLVVGLAVQRALRPSDETDRIAHQVVDKSGARGGAQSGWSARAGGPDDSRPEGGNRSGATERRGRSIAGGGSRGDHDSDDNSGGGGATIGGIGRGVAPDSAGLRPGSGVRVPGGVELGTTGSDRAAFKGARTASGVRMGGGGTETVTGTGGTAAESGTEQEDDLVVSLPLKDGSVEAEKGDSPVVAEGVTYDGGNLRFSTDSQMILPNAGNISGEAGSIAFWIQPDWNGSEDSSAALVDVRTQHTFENRIQIDKNGQYLRFIFADDTGSESGAGAEIGHWQAGEWHNVVATYGEGMTNFYVDGKLVGSKPYTGQFNVLPGTQFRIGSNYPGDGPGAGGAMSDFKVYRRPLGPDEVGQMSTRAE